MTVIPAAELDQLRTVRQAWLTTTATVNRKQTVPDGSGGSTDTYTAVGTYPCSFSKYPIRPLERERAPGIQNLTEWMFFFPYDVVILPTDRIDCEGRHFEIVGGGVALYDLSNRVIALEIL